MDKTEHLKLSQWDPSDRILREDFNRDNQLIDAALAGKAGGLELLHEYAAYGETSQGFNVAVIIDWTEWEQVWFLFRYPQDGGGDKTAGVDFRLDRKTGSRWISPALSQPGYLAVLLPRHDPDANVSGFILSQRFIPFACDFAYREIYGIASGVMDYVDTPSPRIQIFGRR